MKIPTVYCFRLIWVRKKIIFLIKTVSAYAPQSAGNSTILKYLGGFQTQFLYFFVDGNVNLDTVYGTSVQFNL
jgi:hypothetical protein